MRRGSNGAASCRASIPNGGTGADLNFTRVLLFFEWPSRYNQVVLAYGVLDVGRAKVRVGSTAEQYLYIFFYVSTIVILRYDGSHFRFSFHIVRVVIFFIRSLSNKLLIKFCYKKLIKIKNKLLFN